jgi:hypothetical protein
MLRVARLARQASRRLTQVDARTRAIDEGARAPTDGDRDLDRRRSILESLGSFGETSAIALFAEMRGRGICAEGMQRGWHPWPVRPA